MYGLTLDGHPATWIGSGTYGTAYFVDDGTEDGRVVKVLKAHTKTLDEQYDNLDALLAGHLLVMSDVAFVTANAAAEFVREYSMRMASPVPVVLVEMPDGVVVRAARETCGRWSPLVVHRADGLFYALHRDADLVMREMQDIIKTLKTCGPGIVAATLDVVVKDGVDVYSAITMPRLKATHATMGKSRWYRAAPGGTTQILARWTERIVPLVARLLKVGIVCTDISRANIMVDENYESSLIDVDSFLRIDHARRLEPAVGIVSLVPKQIWGRAYLYNPEVLRYAMIFAALVTTVPQSRVPANLYPAYTIGEAMKSHDRLMTLITARAQQLVAEHLGDVREMAQRFAATVYAY